MNIFVLSSLCFGFTSLLLGFFIALKRRDELGRDWLIFNLFIGLWGIGYSFQLNNDVTYEIALWISRVSDAFAILIPVTWLNFIYQYLGQKKPKKLFSALIAITTFLLLMSPTPFFISNLKDKSHIGIDHFVAGGPVFHLFSVLFTAAVAFGFIKIFRAYKEREASEKKRKQMQYFLAATILGFGGGSTAFLPVYDIDIPVLYGTLLMPFLPILLTLAITRYRLLDMEEIAKVAHRDKLATIGTISASINHEIKNPLYIIQGATNGFLEKMKEKKESMTEDDFKKALEIIEKTSEQSNRAMDIMRTLKLFSSGDINQKPQPKQVGVNSVLESVLPLIEQECRLENIQIQNHLRDRDVTIQVDENHLQQILFNLILNSCQGINKDGSLEISGSQTNGHAKIVIKDSGRGMNKEQCKRIFEPFYTTKEEGTGLGLYITKQLVEKNGGKISVESQEGQGTTFKLEFRA